MGWELNMDLSGHRLSDFPMPRSTTGPMAEVDFKPSPLLWVLEIHIRHPTLASARSSRTCCSTTATSPDCHLTS